MSQQCQARHLASSWLLSTAEGDLLHENNVIRFWGWRFLFAFKDAQRSVQSPFDRAFERAGYMGSICFGVRYESIYHDACAQLVLFIFDGIHNALTIISALQ